MPAQSEGQWGACVHRIAYKYAQAPDPAEIVAKAVAASCGQRVAEQINLSEATQRTKITEAVVGSIESLALVKVIEARAGRCAVPE